MQSPFTHILLAIGPDHLERQFKDTLLFGNRELGAQFEIISTVAKERQFLEELIQLEHPEIVVFHELLPHSFDLHTESGKEENEKNILEMLEKWRIFYPNMRVVYVCERDRNDPFLGDLVARNVLDIFYERTISQELLVKQLMEPAQYKNVKHIRVGTVELEQQTETDELENEATTVDIPFFAKVKKGAMEFKESLANKTEKAKKDTKLENNQTNEMPPTPELSAESLEIENKRIDKGEPIPKKGEKRSSFLKKTFSKGLKSGIKKKPLSIQGTVTISVSSLLMQAGSTQLALSLAYLLSKEYESVAIIDANISGDFNRIHAFHGAQSKCLLN